MSILTGKLNQTAVYWAFSSIDGYGTPSFSSGVEKQVRWSQKQEVFLNSERQEELSAGVVHVDFDIAVNDYFYLGNLSDLTDSQKADPMQCNDAYKLKSFTKISNIAGTEFVRKGWIK